ncbi:hypothetical protein DCAR_0312974 [Daucus carota subsp. sativus]|uniref:Uncharacterized protein n=1 Tax=Daucus carota subsp. sativus TaxID=79200 RepID=A0A166BPS1_DAUCS|nr:hypothetical protein DCAR_0312974 [Daucus carota subsp. sativus]
MVSTFFGSTDLGNMDVNGLIWTRFIIGSAPNQTFVLVARYLKALDMVLLIVDGKSTTSKLAFPPRLKNHKLLTESDLPGTRGHPK